MKKALLFTLFISTMLFACCSKDEAEDMGQMPPRLSKSDSLALVKIYQEIGPWGRVWDLKDVSTWSNFQAFLDSAANEYRVWSFEIYNGKCRGTLPKEICDLTELRVLAIFGGTMDGEIPEDIGRLKHLIGLRFGYNNMSGHIPVSVGELTNLTRLDIVKTKISDTIPESVGNLTEMIRMDLYDNQLTGNFPKSLKNLKKLMVIDLENNHLSGTFPIEVLTGSNPCYINLKNNDITELPFEVWDDDFVANEPPVLVKNRLSGHVPEWVLKTKKWKELGQCTTDDQKEGYGYDVWQR